MNVQNRIIRRLADISFWRELYPYAILETILFLGLNLIKLAQLHKSFEMYGRPFSDFIWISIGAMGLMIFWMYWLSFRGKIIVLGCTHFFLTWLMYSDLIYYRYFADLVSVPVLMQINQTGELMNSIYTLIEATDYVYFIDWIIILPYFIYVLWSQRASQFALQEKPPVKKRFSRKSIVSLSALLLSATLFFVPFLQAKNYSAKDLFESNWWNLGLYHAVGLFAYHGFDVYRNARDHWFNDHQLSVEEVNNLKTWLAESSSIRAAHEQDSSFGAYRGANVIVVQVEAMQNFMIGQSYAGQEITPNFNALLKNSAYFSQFYHQTGQGRTSDADFVANCSLYPLPVGSVFIRYAQNDNVCLPRLLKQAGYSTNVFHAFEGGFWNRNMMYSHMGYDTFYSKKDFPVGERVGWSTGDKDFFTQSVQYMAEKPQPFSSFLITLSSHHPYGIDTKYKTLNLGDLNSTILGNYLQSIHYVDAALGLLIQQLKDQGIWNNSMLIVYGDHDNSIHDMKLYETLLGHVPTNLEQLQINKQIPLLIHLPDEKRAGIYPQPRGQIDLAPTILHLLGISSAGLPYMGTPLLTNTASPVRPVKLHDRSFVSQEHYYLASEDHEFTHGKCYDATSGVQIELSACQADAERTATELSYSEQIIKYNYVNPLIKP